MNRFLLPRALALLGGCAAAWLLSGCGAPDVVSRAAAYRAAVQETAKGAAPGDGASATPLRPSAPPERLYPRLRDRRLPVTDFRIGFGEFLSLQGCRLGELAGHRNSQLGRVMVGTRRLAYEIEVLVAGERCLPRLELEERLKLGALLERKRRELPRHVWNAIWTDSELAPYLSREAPPSAEDWGAFGTWALADLGRSLDHIGGVRDAEAIERALSDLRQAAPAGGLLRALHEVGQHLEVAADLLERHGARTCRGATRRLAHLFQDTYLPLQPELSALAREAREVLGALDRVYHATAAQVEAPAAMARFRTERLSLDREDALFGRYRAVVVRHARSWAPVLEACGLLPRAPVRTASRGRDPDRVGDGTGHYRRATPVDRDGPHPASANAWSARQLAQETTGPDVPEALHR